MSDAGRTVTLTNPYPATWSEISDFKYRERLVLFREPDAIQVPGRKDPDYITFFSYTVHYKVDGAPVTLTVPAGMLTDLASVPALFRGLVGRVGRHLEAAIVHDFLYFAWQDVEGGHNPTERDRAFADLLMLRAMQEANVSSWRQQAIYRAVRIGGSGAFFERNPQPHFMPPDTMR